MYLKGVTAVTKSDIDVVDGTSCDIFYTMLKLIRLPQKFMKRGMASKLEKVADRIKSVQPNVWVEFTALARECNAVNVGQGFPDYAPPSYINQTLSEATNSQNPFLNQYTRYNGHGRLVQTLANFYGSLLKRQIDANTQVLATIGAYESLYCIAMAFLSPEDEAIIISPSYDCYEPQVRMAGATPIFVHLGLEKAKGSSTADLKLDFDQLERKLSPRTKLLYLNNPNNPTGKVYTREELMQIADLAVKHDLLVVADEIYEFTVFKPAEMIRFASLPGMWDRTITVGSAGKVFSMTGWKLGWSIGPEKFIRHLNSVHQNSIFTCPTPIQEAVAVCFEHEMNRIDSDDCYFWSLPKLELLPKMKLLAKALEAIGVPTIVPEGGPFILAKYSDVACETGSIGSGPKDYGFVRWLCKEQGLATIPCSAFYSSSERHLGEDWIRLCFFKKDETIDAAFSILKKWSSSRKSS